MQDAMFLFLSCCLKERPITSGTFGLCPGWDIRDQFFESRTGRQRCACRAYWRSWLVSAKLNATHRWYRQYRHAIPIWKRIPTKLFQVLRFVDFCGMYIMFQRVPTFPTHFLLTCLAQQTRTRVVMAWSMSTFARIKRPLSFPMHEPCRERSWTWWCVQWRKTNSRRRRQVSRWNHL